MPVTMEGRTPAVGELAPDFTLESTTGHPLTLSRFRGERPVLLYFFPLAFTGTCTAQLCEMRDNMDAYVGAGAALLAVSVDSVESLREYRARHGLTVALLSDFRREASRAYGVLIPERNFANRAYFLIDREGVIRWRHVEEHPGHRRSDEELLARIRELEDPERTAA